MKPGPRPGRTNRARPEETEIGDLVGPVGSVDGTGTVRLFGESWRLEWAVGSEDRWRTAADEIAVRRSLLDDAPVTVTAMRVPGGDVVQRVAGVSDGTGRAVSVEIENDTPAPVSVALAIRPEGAPGIRTVSVEGDRVVVGGRDAMVVGRPPGGVAVVDDPDPWSAVVSGPASGDAALRSRSGSAAAVVVVPVAHRQQVSLLLPVDGPLPAEAATSSVAAGWRALADRAASLAIEDPETTTEWRRGVPAIVLAAGTTDPERAAAVAPLLDLLGLPDEADRARATLVAAVDRGLVVGRAAAATARALASRRLRSGRESGLAELAADLVGSSGGLVSRLDLGIMAAALDHEDERVARDLREVAAVGDDSRSSATGEGVGGLLDALVSESADGLDLLPAPEQSWLGRPIDARGLATRHGALSFSVRWHGARPALLWQLETHEPVVIRCPALGPWWSSTDARGEALLGPAEGPAD